LGTHRPKKKRLVTLTLSALASSSRQLQIEIRLKWELSIAYCPVLQRFSKCRSHSNHGHIFCLHPPFSFLISLSPTANQKLAQRPITKTGLHIGGR
jgi:hypothetical protein